MEPMVVIEVKVGGQAGRQFGYGGVVLEIVVPLIPGALHRTASGWVILAE